jgi:hypothetical protein
VEQACLQTLAQHSRLTCAVVGQHQVELVAPEACREVRLAHIDGQVLCHHRDGAVSGFVSVAVVDPLQVIHVDHDGAQRVAVAPRALELAVQALDQGAVVGQTGQRIGLGALHQLPLLLPGGDPPRHARPDLGRPHS